MKLYKTIIVIWTEYPTDEVGLEDLGHAATSGDAYCVSQDCTLIPDVEKDPNWDGTEFFGEDDEDDDEDDEDGDGDDLCDSCMRSGVEISHTDDKGDTVCVECAAEENEEWAQHPAPPEFSLRAATDAPAPLKLPYSQHATFRQIAFVAAQNPPTTRCDKCHESDVLIDHIDAQGHTICIECAEEVKG